VACSEKKPDFSANGTLGGTLASAREAAGKQGRQILIGRSTVQSGAPDAHRSQSDVLGRQPPRPACSDCAACSCAVRSRAACSCAVRDGQLAATAG